jgi:hypothetical protein
MTTENIIIYQNADFQRTISLSDANNEPLNVSGFSANATMKNDPYTTNTNFQTFETDLANGSLTLTMWANTTANLYPGYYVYDVVLYNGVDTYRVLEGIAQVSPGVSIL